LLLLLDSEKVLNFINLKKIVFTNDDKEKKYISQLQLLLFITFLQRQIYLKYSLRNKSIEAQFKYLQFEDVKMLLYIISSVVNYQPVQYNDYNFICFSSIYKYDFRDCDSFMHYLNFHDFKSNEPITLNVKVYNENNVEILSTRYCPSELLMDFIDFKDIFMNEELYKPLQRNGNATNKRIKKLIVTDYNFKFLCIPKFDYWQNLKAIHISNSTLCALQVTSSVTEICVNNTDMMFLYGEFDSLEHLTIMNVNVLQVFCIIFSIINNIKKNVKFSVQNVSFNINKQINLSVLQDFFEEIKEKFIIEDFPYNENFKIIDFCCKNEGYKDINIKNLNSETYFEFFNLINTFEIENVNCHYLFHFKNSIYFPPELISIIKTNNSIYDEFVANPSETSSNNHVDKKVEYKEIIEKNKEILDLSL